MDFLARRAVAVAAAVAVIAFLTVPAAALGATPRTTLLDIEDEVMCTVCGVPLNQASNAPAAQEQRELINRLIAEGKTREQVKQRLAAELGPEVLAVPRQSGFQLTAYLVPIALFLAALGALAFAVPRWLRRRPRPGAETGGPELDAADARRLDEELARSDP